MDSVLPKNLITPQQYQRVAYLLGREPRGLREISIIDQKGSPVVIRVASVINGKPFPTLYWLIDSGLCLKIDRLEAEGWIGCLQKWVDHDIKLREAMIEDHNHYRTARHNFLSSDDYDYLLKMNMHASLEDRGIGGIARPDRIRCLHTWYAAHLVTSNTIGRLMEEIF